MKKEMVGLQPVSVSEGMEGDPSDASLLTQEHTLSTTGIACTVVL